MGHFSSSLFRIGLLLLTILTLTVQGQPTTTAQADSLLRVLQVSKPDTHRVSILLQLSNFYLNNTVNPKRDLDSALTLVRQAGELSKSLDFAKGMENADFLKGKIYIYKQNTGFVHSIFESLCDTNRIKLLLELGNYHLWPSYTQNVHLDSALLFFRKAESLCEAKGNQKWKEESQLQIGTYYLNQGDFNQGKPLRLIINEALTNAFKYAFPHGRSGRIGISLQQPEPGQYVLEIKDDGVGLPENYDPGRSRSLGMTLLHGFSEQLGGELTLTSPPGMHIQLLFAEEKLTHYIL
jgi:signal transduction histidine kinase